MTKRRVNVKHCIALCLWIISAILLAMTPWFVDIVNETRAVNGFGGECLIWLFPLLISMFLMD